MHEDGVEEGKPVVVSIAPAKTGEHHYRCPTCLDIVDIPDLDEAAEAP